VRTREPLVAHTTPPSPAGRLSEEDLRQLAAICRDAARRFFDVTLDLSPASLAVADRIISQALETPEPTLGAVLPWGAYLGEVVVRHLDGRWAPRDPLLDTAVIVGQRTLLPFRRAAQRLRGGAAYALERCYQDLAEGKEE
jgi:hypothetical protein